ncbi:agmatine deiminase family protein [Jejudonia soesokkakensis]|uniref:Agmatine deiminase family protein n=1 Tax=Jejudonia soesokkakensis TaxID=1323432 RepID=A0ABW2MX12_9FLAO
MKIVTKSHLLISCLLTITMAGFGQQPVPHYTTDAEKRDLSNYQFNRSILTDPPAEEVRTMAEWEEVEFLVVTWEPNFPNILRQIVAAAVEECKVIITTQNESSVASYLTSNGVDLTNVTFMDENWDTLWIRDYGGNTVYTNDVGERALVDWIYNRPRPNDDIIPSAHSNLEGIPIYITNSGTNDLVNTGGNFMSDGLGNAFASELILEENEPGNPYGVSAKTEEQIDDIMQAYMGIDNYIKMTPLPFDVINHIDMHMKLLDEETLLVAEYPQGVADGPQIEANIDYILQNFQSPFGTPYKIKRIPSPPSVGGNYPDNGGSYRNYANAIFVNKTILIPLYRPEVDAPAIAKWEEMMPGYNIVGIDVDNPDENLISLVGAIHCITHTIGVSDPLWIVHQPIAQADSGATVAVDAMIKHNSGIASATMYWREEGTSDFSQTSMTLESDSNWTTDFSIPSSTTSIEYYIEATANSGKTLTRPIVAPEGYWTIDVRTLGINDSSENNIVGPYPNPTSDTVLFSFKSISKTINITITNVLGQQLNSFTLDVASENTIEISMEAYADGVLFVNFEGSFGKVTKKIIKK